MHSESDILRAESQEVDSQSRREPVNPGSLTAGASEDVTRFADRENRKVKIRSTFGKTTKSPFLWSVVRSDRNEFAAQLQDLHDSFWSDDEKLPVNFTFDADQDGPDYQAALLHLVCCAYGLEQECAIFEQPVSKDFDAVRDPLLQQLLTIELPLWQQFVNDQSSDDQGVGCLSDFEKMVDDLLDKDGWIEGYAITDWGLISASWCRTHQLLRAMGLRIDLNTQLAQLAEQLLRNSREDGSLLHGEPGSGINCKAFRKAVCNLAQGFSRQSLGSKSKSTGRAPAQTSISEWAQVGVLRRNWKPKGNKVGFTFDSKRIRLDIDNGRTLICGECMPQLAIDGQVITPSDEIGVSCFLRFEQGEYVELEVEYGAWKLQRQLLLLSDEQLLLVADNLIGDAKSKIDYRCRYPLGANQQIVKETETNEFYLRDGDRYCLVLPLAFPEWKTEKRNGNVEFGETDFEVSYTQLGSGMSFPLLFDLNPKRSVKPRTWRRLTVAEQMAPVAPDVAVAYRVQIARKQWVFYRTLAEPGNRTFLGENFADDFFVGSMNLNGTVKALLEVE